MPHPPSPPVDPIPLRIALAAACRTYASLIELNAIAAPEQEAGLLDQILVPLLQLRQTLPNPPTPTPTPTPSVMRKSRGSTGV